MKSTPRPLSMRMLTLAAVAAVAADPRRMQRAQENVSEAPRRERTRGPDYPRPASAAKPKRRA